MISHKASVSASDFIKQLTAVPIVDARCRVGVDNNGYPMVEQSRARGRIRRGGGLGPRHSDAFDASGTNGRRNIGEASTINVWDRQTHTPQRALGRRKRRTISSEISSARLQVYYISPQRLRHPRANSTSSLRAGKIVLQVCGEPRRASMYQGVAYRVCSSADERVLLCVSLDGDTRDGRCSEHTVLSRTKSTLQLAYAYGQRQTTEDYNRVLL